MHARWGSRYEVGDCADAVCDRGITGVARGLLRPVRVFLVSDEEVGSRSSRKITEALAKKSAGVLVLEARPVEPRGAVKTARKGVGEYRLRVKGVAAHAGLDPAKGHSAIVELARQIEVMAKVKLFCARA